MTCRELTPINHGTRVPSAAVGVREGRSLRCSEGSPWESLRNTGQGEWWAHRVISELALNQSSLVAHLVKNLPAIQEIQVRSLGQEDPLEKEMVTHSSYSCLENSMERGVWWATVYGIAKNRTQLSD